ncbi:MAG TPA: sigma-70 family RNA polymerase sigma factor [Candidatus Ventricola intestinavium]|nr:sigma-70 family RNA polymerase sigma factor [Candidatus Ventricola intestinavium]
MSAYTEDMREAMLVRLMQQYGDSVKRMCLLYLHDTGTAEDAAQETFIKVYEHMDELLAGSIVHEKAWLMRIAINQCKDMLRSSWMRHIDRWKVLEELPLSVTHEHEENLSLTQAILNLAPKYREIVLLHYYQDLDLRTCAQILGISAPTATRRLQQAQKKLRIEMERG